MYQYSSTGELAGVEEVCDVSMKLLLFAVKVVRRFVSTLFSLWDSRQKAFRQVPAKVGKPVGACCQVDYLANRPVISSYM